MSAYASDSDATEARTPSGRHVQRGILDESTTTHCVQQYRVVLGVDVAALRSALGAIRDLETRDDGPGHVVVAFGASLFGTLAPGEMPAGMRPFTRIEGSDGHQVPATQDDVFLWFSADAADRCLAAAWSARGHLDGLAELTAETPGFVYFANRDLTGFEDGTENPRGSERIDVAAITDGPAVGGSFVLAQRWVHDLRGFERLSVDEQEAVIGRTKAASIELDPLPHRSHVERVELTGDDGSGREIYRRSFPYGTTDELGLFFLAFSGDLATFQDMLERMVGAADGSRDRLTDFSTAVSSAFYVAPSIELLDTIVTG